jgi:glucose-1-phosphate thymidylyltransferase
MKGIVLAGGKGTRLLPTTQGLSKHLIPIYNKPLIYYPIATLMLAGVREILVIVKPNDRNQFEKNVGNGDHLGMSITYAVQNEPRGLADAFLVGEHFIKNENTALILGDNIFYGQGLGVQLSAIDHKYGAKIFGYKVSNPQDYGVVEFSEDFKVVSIQEKPLDPKSNYAIPGLYFFDSQVIDFAKNVRPSDRGELEITSILNEYNNLGMLKLEILERGTLWLDAGTVETMFAASNFVRTIETRQGFMIGCLEEIAWRNNWIGDEELAKIAKNYGESDYADYLYDLLL